MAQALDDIMQAASRALSDQKLAQCESMCLDALRQARAAKDWAYYHRIVLPLQESRRLKRQAALDGPIRLGVADRPDDVASLLPNGDVGGVVLTQPCTADDATELVRLATEQGKDVEVLLVDSAIRDEQWAVTSFVGPTVTAKRPAPPQSWRDTWVNPQATAPPTPAHWFMQASEALGDAGLSSITRPLGSVERVVEIEGLLQAAGDHELLHQALADAARAVQKADG